MKIKSMIAGLMAGVLMMGNLSAVCFAADNSPVSTEGAAGTEFSWPVSLKRRSSSP